MLLLSHRALAYETYLCHPLSQSSSASGWHKLEHPQVKFMWNLNTALSQSFTNFFLKVYSPGDVTQADLIIVNSGLYWLFLECMYVTKEHDKRNHFEAQAIISRNNLETVLSQLPFHLPSTIEITLAMSLAALYCLEVCQPSAAWNFITTAAHMSQTLGFHSHVAMTQDNPEVQKEKRRIFWLVYVLEKGLSLRMGRSSTIRDGDITIPRPRSDTVSNADMMSIFPGSTEFATIQGMVYDQIYSPAALMQPQSVRVERARRLGADLEMHMRSVMDHRKRYIGTVREIIGEQLQEAFIRTDTVNQLSLCCLIHRAIPPEAGEISAFGGACIASARQALEEHQRCMILVAGMEEYYLEAYINWALLSSPFIPFIVLFCHVIETCNESDLRLLAALVDTLRSTVADSFTIGVKKEVRMFTTLYDVACSYVKLRSDEDSSQLAEVQFKNGWEFADENVNPPVLQPSICLASPGAASDQQTLGQTSNTSNMRPFGDVLNDHEPANQEWTSGSLSRPENYLGEVDDYGSQLGNWLYMNNQMIRALENNYFG
ncbi:hypothetical protein CaCOL14_003488 [Colletotrichum acutatum]